MLVLGFCGGLDESSVPGEVIVAEEVYAAADENHPEEPIVCDLATPLLGRLTGLGMKVRTGRVVCVSKLALGERRAAAPCRGRDRGGHGVDLAGGGGAGAARSGWSGSCWTAPRTS